MDDDMSNDAVVLPFPGTPEPDAGPTYLVVIPPDSVPVAYGPLDDSSHGEHLARWDLAVILHGVEARREVVLVSSLADGALAALTRLRDRGVPWNGESGGLRLRALLTERAVELDTAGHRALADLDAFAAADL